MDEKDLKIQDLKIENEQLKKNLAEYQRKCESFSLKLHGLLNDKAVLEAELENAIFELNTLDELYGRVATEREKALEEVRYLKDKENAEIDYALELMGW